MFDINGIAIILSSLLISAAIFRFTSVFQKRRRIKSTPKKVDFSNVPYAVRDAMKEAKEAAFRTAREEIDNWKKELLPGVDIFVEKQFDYFLQVYRGYVVALTNAFGLGEKYAETFLKKDVEDYILTLEVANKRVENIAEKTLHEYLSKFEGEIREVKFTDELQSVEDYLPDLCILILKHGSIRQITSEGFLVEKGLIDIAIFSLFPMIQNLATVMVGKIAFTKLFFAAILKGFFIPPVVLLAISCDYVWHRRKARNEKVNLRNKILSYLDEVLESILNGTQGSIKVLILELENAIAEDTLKKYPSQRNLFSGIFEERMSLQPTIDLKLEDVKVIPEKDAVLQN